MFWLWMFLIMLAVVGVTVLAAKMLTPRPRDPSDPGDRRRNITALKVSGAFPHRKSNRP